MALLDEILVKLQAMPPEAVRELEQEMSRERRLWTPSPGPQTDAYYSKADLLLYGGAGGSGKSDLGLGLAFQEHQRSLIMRRQYANLSALIERAVEINGTRDGFNGSPPPLLRSVNGKYIQFGANQRLGDEQDWQGQPFDFKYFDEGVQFLEQQIRFHLGWLRTTKEGQRCRAVIGTNPPLDANGDFIVGMFRPWLDVTHPKPAKPGELRWYVTAPDGTDLEIKTGELKTDESGRKFTDVQGQKVLATSRTFIPGRLKDNPFLVNTNYQAQLDGLPEPLRSAVRDGNFMATRKDAEWQVIPTEWVIQAQARWKPDGHKRFKMTAMALDPAGGGKDSEELIWRHGPWYAEPISAQGEQTAKATGATTSVFMHRRDGCPLVIDVGGGYAGAVLTRMGDNAVPCIKFNGASAGVGRAKDTHMTLANKRAEAWWKFREALDANQQGGSEIELPPDPELRADLTAPCLDTRALETRGVIQVESKDNLRQRLGRSPGKGDVAVMCWAEGSAAVKRVIAETNAASRPAYSNVGYTHMKRRRA